MTMMSFRIEEEEAARVQQWADALSMDKSELLREAVHQHLVRLAAANEASIWDDIPLTESESSLSEIADWGPAEDWSDWA